MVGEGGETVASCGCVHVHQYAEAGLEEGIMVDEQLKHLELEVIDQDEVKLGVHGE